MVRYSTIFQTIESYVEKCGMTIKEIRQKLNGMELMEIVIGLDENHLLNRGEEEWYEGIVERIESVEGNISTFQALVDDGNKDYEIDLDIAKSQLEILKEEKFEYDKRLFNGYKPKEGKTNSKIDEKDYYLDEQLSDLDTKLTDLEQAQINSQMNVGLEPSHYVALYDYFGQGAKNINSRLNDGKRWNNYSKAEKDSLKGDLDYIEKNLDSAIDKSEGLIQNTILFHGGQFDLTKVVGDKIKFKGYTSASFQEGVAEQFEEYSTIPHEKYYTFKILVPKGTKGICANAERQDIDYQLTNNFDEHEYLLGKGLEAEIVDIDYDNHIVTIAI